ncbi:hypothetical protein DB346_15945 [Verrucomicrobia bacterium LW23]|nr:hypothetical protein DB346_15945 [Verrucomicrobia bacterium LW23]
MACCPGAPASAASSDAAAAAAVTAASPATAAGAGDGAAGVGRAAVSGVASLVEDGVNIQRPVSPVRIAASIVR